MYKTLLLLPLIYLMGCCPKNTASGNFMLDDTDNEKIPYTLDQQITFKHSSGFSFQFTVSKNLIENTRTQTEHCGDEFWFYQYRQVQLSSDNPELYVAVKTYPADFIPYLELSVNNYEFKIDYSTEPTYNDFTINGQNYCDVYECTYEYIYDDKIIPETIWYNKTEGLLKIKMTNHETYEINQ